MPGWTGVFLRRVFAARMFGFTGKKPYIEPGLRVEYPQRLSTGDNVRVAERVLIWADGGVKIGHNVMLGPDSKIYSSRHSYEDPDTPVNRQEGILKQTVIEDDVWLGAGVVVLLGVTIGKGAVIAAGTVVNRSIPPYAVVAGNPGRVVHWRRPPDQASRPEASDAE